MGKSAFSHKYFAFLVFIATQYAEPAGRLLKLPWHFVIVGREVCRGFVMFRYIYVFLMLSLATFCDAAERPGLSFEQDSLQQLLATAFDNALGNLLDINTLAYDEKRYNSTGLLHNPPGAFIRAGGSYPTPWTRDASINSWNAASLLAPEAARNTLWAVCRRDNEGRLVLQQDNQWWDQIIWVVGAWSHYTVTGDRRFLADAYQASINSLKIRKAKNINEEYGLFEGPAVLADGIAGYSAPPHIPGGSSFVLDYPDTDKMMCLSTNCVYYGAYRCLAEMARELGLPDTESQGYVEAAEQLKQNINKHFWIKAKGIYGYFIHGGGSIKGKLDQSQEGMGLAYAVIFGVADADKIQAVMKNVHLEPKGITCVWPHFERFSDDKPGRHCVTVWPMCSGMWAHAVKLAGHTERFGREMTIIAELTGDSDGIFYEIYNSISGRTDGGWQCERHWDSVINQTWSATGYLRMVFHGLFGMQFDARGLSFAPCLPEGWSSVKLSNVQYRNALLEVVLEGAGNRIESCTVNGKQHQPRIEPGATGKQKIVISLCKRRQ